MKIYFNGFIERMESKNKRQNRTEKQKKQNKTKITSRNAFRNLSSHFRSIIQRKKIRRYSKSIRDRKSIFFSISSTRRSSCYVNYINCNHYLRWSHCSGEKASLLLLNTYEELSRTGFYHTFSKVKGSQRPMKRIEA